MKEYADTIFFLWSMLTGLFAFTALAIKDYLRISKRCPVTYTILLGIMLVGGAIALFEGFQVKSALAQGLLASTVDWYAIQNLIARQAWGVTISAAADVGLVGDALLRVES